MTAILLTTSSSSPRGSVREIENSSADGISFVWSGNWPSIRRVVSHTSSTPKITWFSSIPIWIVLPRRRDPAQLLESPCGDDRLELGACQRRPRSP